MGYERLFPGGQHGVGIDGEAAAVIAVARPVVGRVIIIVFGVIGGTGGE